MLRSVILVSAFFLIAYPGESHGCGSVTQAFWSNLLEADKERLESFLESQSCGDAEHYSPERAEPYIALVLINAIEAGVSEETIEATFSLFNCASTVRNRVAYKKIVNFLGEEKFSSLCDLALLERMYLVKASGGASFREAPSTSARRLGAVAEGGLVKNAEPHGEWFFVRTYKGSGYMHRSTLKPYLGES